MERKGEKKNRDQFKKSRMSPEASNYTQQENYGELTNTQTQVITHITQTKT